MQKENTHAGTEDRFVALALSALTEPLTPESGAGAGASGARQRPSAVVRPDGGGEAPRVT